MSQKLSKTEKQKRGTNRAVRDKKINVKDISQHPHPGVDLTLSQSTIYNRICDHLKEHGALMDIDCYIVGCMAVAIDVRNEAIRLMNAEGLIQEFENGTRNLSPEFSAFQKANNEIRQLSKCLGMDARSRLTMDYFMEKKEEPVDPIAELLKRAV